MKKTVLFLLVFLVLNQTQAQEDTGRLRALYLYNFAKYIQWPNDAPVVVIGILNQFELADRLTNDLKDRKVQNKPIEIKKLRQIEETINCQIVYIPKSQSRFLAGITQLVGEKAIVIVTEEELSSKGATIGFYQENNHIKFTLNQSKLARSGLTASPGLISMAKLVFDK